MHQANSKRIQQQVVVWQAWQQQERQGRGLTKQESESHLIGGFHLSQMELEASDSYTYDMQGLWLQIPPLWRWNPSCMQPFCFVLCAWAQGRPRRATQGGVQVERR